MLPRTFVFLPGVGPKTEARLWRRGIADWDAYEERARSPHRERHLPILARARDALARRDSAFFAGALPSTETWRTWPHFGDGAIAVDIETNNDGLTVVGLHGPSAILRPEGPFDRDRGNRCTRLFVRGVNLDVGAISEALAPAGVVLTYNGAAFDLPYLREAGVRVPAAAHIDLVHVLHRAGLKGGLKRIEREVGIRRPPEVENLSGYDAILLWRQHELGDAEALGRLCTYNACDVESLPELAGLGYDRLAGRMLPFAPERPLELFPLPYRPAQPAA